MSKTVAAIFDEYKDAETAARRIKEQGLRTDDISIITKQDNGAGETDTGRGKAAGMATGPSFTMGRKVNDNISDGTISGGVLGGLAGLLIGAGTMMIPGFGIVAAAGPVTGLMSGAITGGIVGGLIDLGIPENRSRQYETDIKAGKVFFSMKTENENVERVAGILRDNRAISVDSY